MVEKWRGGEKTRREQEEEIILVISIRRDE
jgi:hypothetical protein